jgi:DNA-binding response OmpR family regulator
MSNKPINNNILIVDDDLDLLNILQGLLEKYNYNVVTATNGKECLRELEKGFKGIILLDVMMPVMDGLETIKNMIKEGFIDFNKIVLLTAKKIQGEEFDDIYQYIDKYIHKPFDIDELIKAIDELSSNIKSGKSESNINI